MAGFGRDYYQCVSSDVIDRNVFLNHQINPYSHLAWSGTFSRTSFSLQDSNYITVEPFHGLGHDFSRLMLSTVKVTTCDGVSLLL